MNQSVLFHNETFVNAGAKTVVIADDLTGSFDTGVQFSKRGATVRVVTADGLSRGCSRTDVLVIDAETRHVAPEDTYRRTYAAARWAKENSAEYYYVKTDSGLRGHIGASLKAVMDATGVQLSAFAPAYPDMNRITRDGKQWVDGVLLAESVFGKDPFDPVHTSKLADVIEPYGLGTIHCRRGQGFTASALTQTVALFDAESNEDLSAIARLLRKEGCLHVTAGCAAFAAALNDSFGLPNRLQASPVITSPLLVVCGSLNPITMQQLAYGERNGGIHIVLTAQQLLEPEYLESTSGMAWLEEMRSLLMRKQTLILTTGAGQAEVDHGIRCSREEARKRISKRMGALLEKLLDMPESQPYTPMIIGGDTLVGYLERRPVLELKLEGEIATGVAAFRCTDGSDSRLLLSKSGGLGGPTLLNDILSEESKK